MVPIIVQRDVMGKLSFILLVLAYPFLEKLASGTYFEPGIVFSQRIHWFLWPFD
jgi:hypothetical protein